MFSAIRGPLDRHPLICHRLSACICSGHALQDADGKPNNGTAVKTQAALAKVAVYTVRRFPAPGKWTYTYKLQEAAMDVDDLKKILAGFCIAGLIAGSTFTLNSCASGKSG